jgi:hypothetical protein
MYADAMTCSDPPQDGADHRQQTTIHDGSFQTVSSRTTFSKADDAYGILAAPSYPPDEEALSGTLVQVRESGSAIESQLEAMLEASAEILIRPIKPLDHCLEERNCSSGLNILPEAKVSATSLLDTSLTAP